MCLGSIARLVAIRDDAGVAIGRIEDGCEVPLSFVPRARVGDQLLLHLGIPVEILDADAAREALALRGASPEKEGDRA
jgi:hydrogenase maturation factor